MKKVIIAFAIFLFATSYVEAAETKKIQQTIQPAPKFQIVPVEYRYLNLNGDNVKKAVLKIDVFTGKTWILRDDTYRISNEKVVVNRGWEELEINIETNDPTK